MAVRDRVLHADGRLVTMTGTGGTGKTTLATEVARALEEEMPDGVALIDLSAVREDDDLATECCESLGLIEHDRPPMTVLAGHLAPRQALVVLDNCEHLLPQLATLVDRLLDACPDLRVLATSRAPLRVRGESLFAVPPMPVPDADVHHDLDRLGEVPAVALFVERAVAARPDFRLAEWAPSVASICRRLDGLPLAIELAAAQTVVLSPVEIDRRLATGPDLWDGAVSASVRRRTMDATLDWSYDLLGEDEQATFRRLAVFTGGWTLDAAEQVCALGADPSTVAPALVTLADASMIVRDRADGGSRFRMLAPVADYAGRRLAGSGERDAASLAHAEHYLALARPPSPDWRVVDPGHLDRIALEYDNCLAALRVAEERRDVRLVLGLDISLLLFWRVRGLLRSGRRRLEAAVTVVGEVVGEQPSLERGLVLAGVAHFAQLLGDLDPAEANALEAEAVFEAIGDPVARRTVLGFLGDIASDRGDVATARERYERALTLRPGPGDGLDLGLCHANLGRLAARDGDHVTAERELERARDHLASGPGWYSAHVLVQLGSLARLRGDLDRAETLLRAAVEHLRAYGATVEAIGCLEELARLAVDRADRRRAATLFSAATGLRDATALARSEADRQALTAGVEHVRARLAPRAFADAWARGAGLSLDAAAAVAAGRDDAPTRPPSRTRGPALTPRERQVAALVAEGLSNPQIAEQLAIAHGTARIHVERILGKLGLSSRVQIATWVVGLDRADEDGSGPGARPRP